MEEHTALHPVRSTLAPRHIYAFSPTFWHELPVMAPRQCHATGAEIPQTGFFIRENLGAMEVQLCSRRTRSEVQLCPFERRLKKP